jgi:hypothetical protein
MDCKTVVEPHRPLGVPWHSHGTPKGQRFIYFFPKIKKLKIKIKIKIPRMLYMINFNNAEI